MTNEFERRVLGLRDLSRKSEELQPKPEVAAMSERISPWLYKAQEILEGSIQRDVIEGGDKVVYVLGWGKTSRGQITLSVRGSSLAFMGGGDQYTRLTAEETEDPELLRSTLAATLEHPVNLPPTHDVFPGRGQQT